MPYHFVCREPYLSADLLVHQDLQDPPEPDGHDGDHGAAAHRRDQTNEDQQQVQW